MGRKVEETRVAVSFQQREDVVDDLDDTVLRGVDLREESGDLRIRHETGRKRRWGGGLADVRCTQKLKKTKVTEYISCAVS